MSLQYLEGEASGPKLTYCSLFYKNQVPPPSTGPCPGLKTNDPLGAGLSHGTQRNECRATTCETRQKREQSVHPQKSDNKYWASTNETCRALYYNTHSQFIPALQHTATPAVRQPTTAPVTPAVQQTTSAPQHTATTAVQQTTPAPQPTATPAV